MNIIKRKNRSGNKIVFYYDLGRKPGQRPSTGIFIYTKPKDQVQKNHNKEALALIEVKKSQTIIEQQSIGSAYIPKYRLKANFIEYYEEYVHLNKRKGNRHLVCSLTQFKMFVRAKFISFTEITENFCKRFRQFLLDKYSGETPSNYYARFKWVVNAAKKDGYFHQNPTEYVAAKSKPSTKLKDNLEVEDYLQLLRTPCFNQEVKAAFIFCCYTGLRWVDIAKIEWSDIREGVITTRMIQAKTGEPVLITLHPIAELILNTARKKTAVTKHPNAKVFPLPSANGVDFALLKFPFHTIMISKIIGCQCLCWSTVHEIDG